MQANPRNEDLRSHLQFARVYMPHFRKGDRLAVAFLSKNTRDEMCRRLKWAPQCKACNKDTSIQASLTSYQRRAKQYIRQELKRLADLLTYSMAADVLEVWCMG